MILIIYCRSNAQADLSHRYVYANKAMFILCGCCYFITIFRKYFELFETLSLNDLMYKYFCNLSLGLKFRECFFSFTGYNMPMIKASKIWSKLSLSPLVILVKRPVCLCLNRPSITCMHIYVDKYILNVHKVVNS